MPDVITCRCPAQIEYDNICDQIDANKALIHSLRPMQGEEHWMSSNEFASAQRRITGCKAAIARLERRLEELTSPA
jgi:hypothetical protein